MGFRLKNIICIFLSVTYLSGCMKDELAKGSRVDISEQIVNSVDSLQIELPKQVKRRSWGGPVSTTLVGSNNYLIREVIELSWTLNTGLDEIIGSPVIYDNKIFVFGANGQVSCINLLDRKTVWNISVHQINTIKKRIIGGGLSFDYAGNLYVTTSLGELLSVSIESGLINWRYNTDAPIIDKPTVIHKNIIITDTSGVSRSVSSKGKLNWVVAGLSGDYIHSKIGKPVAFGELVLLPSAGGVLSAVNSQNGVKVWSFSYSSQRLGYAQNAFGVFNGDPSVFAEKNLLW
jgi:outer membrane protein assembly factor BamB